MPKTLAERLADARATVAYWREVVIDDFIRELHQRMERAQPRITHEELAKRLGTSRPNVTQLLDGGNFTLNTMVRLSMALSGVLRVHIADQDAMTRWFDELPGDAIKTVRLGQNAPVWQAMVQSDVPEYGTQGSAASG